MAEKISEKVKNFFAKKKADSKFKKAGPGHKLTETSSTSVVAPQKKPGYVPPPKTEPSEARRAAAEAALSRLSNQKKDSTFNTSLAAIQAKVRRELEAEKKNNAESNEIPFHGPKQTELETSPHLAVKGVYFKCPLISDEVLTKEEWKVKIKEFLFAALEEERGITACLILYSCNYNRSKVQECVNILCRYIDNIMANPTETKFHKIRCSNQTFSEKVAPLLGATEFLFAAGFRQQKLEHNGTEEDFWVWSEDNLEGTTLEFLRDALKSENRIELELDRNLQVLSPAQAAVRVELPHDFYAMSPEEIKKEQQTRSEMAEKQLQLRTKAMREKDELREIRKYKFSLIRIRFPDGIYLQGTFSVYEKFSEIMDFVRENLEHEGLPFVLGIPTGQKFDEKDFESTLQELRLVPATILIFQWDPAFNEEIKASGSTTYLKPEVTVLMQEM